MRIREWFRPPRHVLTIFLAVALVSGTALATLAWLLVRQDKALELQRRQERMNGRSFFWDGRVPTLEEQVLKPIQDPNEMDLTLEQASSRVGLPLEKIACALASLV